MIPEAAVEAAARAQYEEVGLLWDDETVPDWDCEDDSLQESYRASARAALEAAAPHMLAEADRELSDAKRVIALLVLDAGGKVAISRRAVTELSNDAVIETTQDVINGGWVIRAKQ